MPFSRILYPCLIEEDRTSSNKTEKMLSAMYSINTNKQTHTHDLLQKLYTCVHGTPIHMQ